MGQGVPILARLKSHPTSHFSHFCCAGSCLRHLLNQPKMSIRTVFDGLMRQAQLRIFRWEVALHCMSPPIGDGRLADKVISSEL